VPGLDRYLALGGGALHLHGEGGETHSRAAAGRWLREHDGGATLFVCMQVCHDGWDERAARPIDRFTADAVRADIAEDLALIERRRIDLAYLDDRPDRRAAPVLDALAGEIAAGRVGAVGLRNWPADRIAADDASLKAAGAPGVAAIVTTELALPVASQPLWPEYVPFDAELRRTINDLGLAVFAHAADYTIGQCLFGDADPRAAMRPEWVRRWEPKTNAPLVAAVRATADRLGASPRAVSVAWMLSREFPVSVIVGLPDLLGPYGGDYVRAAELAHDPAIVALGFVREGIAG